MKAIAYRQAHPISHAESLVDITLPDPVAHGRDLLVEVKAGSGTSNWRPGAGVA